MRELEKSELMMIEGGSWLSRTWDNIVYVADKVVDAVVDAAVWVWEHIDKDPYNL